MHVIKDVDKNYLKTTYTDMHECKKYFVDPVILDDYSFVKKWESEAFETNPYPFERDDLITDKGELVRSKSELFIANLLLTFETANCTLNANTLKAMFERFLLN